jgi:hypothetical protein
VDNVEEIQTVYDRNKSLPIEADSDITNDMIKIAAANNNNEATISDNNINIRPRRSIVVNYRQLAGIKAKANISSTTSNLNTINRKLLNAKIQAKIEKDDRKLHPTDPKLNNRLTSILPIVPPNTHIGEMTIPAARKVLPNDKIDDAIKNELNKQFTDYKSLAPITKDNIEKNAVVVRALMFIKQKRDNTIKARLCMNAKQQPSNTYNKTYAGTSDTTIRLFILSVYLADAATRGISGKVQIVDFDIPGAFLHNKLTRKDTNGIQLIQS